MAYFDLFPNVELPSFSNKRNSNYDTIVVKNLFKRGRVRNDIYGNVTSFSKYLVLDGERPDTVARKLYDDEQIIFQEKIKKGLKQIVLYLEMSHKG